MCGIVGIINKNKYGFNKAEIDAFEIALFLDTLRGEDSTGVFLVTNDGNVDIAKQVGTGAEFLKTQEWSKLRQRAMTSGWALIGHNRKATKGSITDENAHPFWVKEDVVLVHNGSLWGHKSLADTEVDSHAIAHIIAEGLEKETDLETTLQRINGAFALVWYEVEKKNLRLVRNSERPLTHCHNKNAWFISSESGIMDFATKRAECKDMVAGSNFPVGNLHTWNLHEDKGCDLSYRDIAFREPTQSIACGWVSYFQERQEHHTIIPNSGEGKEYVLKKPCEAFEELIDNRQIPYKWERGEEYFVFNQMRRNGIANGERVRVVVEDWWPCIHDSNTVTLVGRYNDYAIGFSIPLIDYQKLEENEETKELQYFVTIDNHKWLPDPENRERGYGLLWANQPTQVAFNTV